MTVHSLSAADSDGSQTSRRALLRSLTTAPVAAVAVPLLSPPHVEATERLRQAYGDTPGIIARTRAGRAASRHRYHRAEGFCPDRERLPAVGWHHFLYTAGITAQLALSSHLLDVGFSDQWCAHHIGLRVAKSLAYANATGFGHECPDMARLATVLTPYNVWNEVRLFGEAKPDDGNFTPDEIIRLLRALLERVHDVTGHPRPNRWRRDGRSKLS